MFGCGGLGLASGARERLSPEGLTVWRGALFHPYETVTPQRDNDSRTRSKAESWNSSPFPRVSALCNSTAILS
eukprot:scaffold648466_cov38-Prasinocladus_malaysianus.AAC.1